MCSSSALSKSKDGDAQNTKLGVSKQCLISVATSTSFTQSVVNTDNYTVTDSYSA